MLAGHRLAMEVQGRTINFICPLAISLPDMNSGTYIKKSMTSRNRFFCLLIRQQYPNTKESLMLLVDLVGIFASILQFDYLLHMIVSLYVNE